MNKVSRSAQSREYMTALFRRHSMVALCCCLLSLTLAFIGVIISVSTYAVESESGFYTFIYFTLISNTLAAITSTLIIPFAVEGIRRMRFTMPEWVAVAHYCSACSVGIVTAFTFAFISWAAPKSAFGGSNLFLHVFCPPLILISFFEIENDHIYTLRDRLIGGIPFFIYSLVYMIEVVLIGKENGGWPDIYHVCEKMSPFLAYPLMLLFAFGITSLVAWISNRLTRKRIATMYSCWTEDTNPMEVRIEAYGFGRLAGMKGDKNSIQVPFDILEMLAKKYRIDPDDLLKSFVAGLRYGLKEREDKARRTLPHVSVARLKEIRRRERNRE